VEALTLPRSMLLIYVGCTSASSASFSCERPCDFLWSRTWLPTIIWKSIWFMMLQHKQKKRITT